jgi:hypothetical protein
MGFIPKIRFMKEIRIKNSIKLYEVENLYNQLYEGSEDIINLRLPRYIDKYFFSLAPSLIQFAATWVRSDRKGKLIIDLQIGDDKSAEKYYEQEIFFPIISLAWNDIVIENLSKENLRAFLRDHQNNFILKMRRSEAMKGEKLLLVNLDHFDSETGILKIFEQNGEFNANEEDLESVLKNPILEDVIKYGRSKIEIQKKFHAIVGIIFELMKNTFEWGRTNELNGSLGPNVRGLYLRAYKKTLSNISEENAADKIISDYLSNLVGETNDSKQVFFLEISVFDAGSGFIKKFNKKDNIEDHFSILKSCLIKHQTSSTGDLENDKGIGLDRILNLLDDIGFVRIKTDKYCVYRNMIKNRYRLAENFNPELMELFDWDTESPKSLTVKTLSAGSLVSILYPISFTNNREDE